MERDFLGLLSVKEENTDVTVESVLVRESGMQWSFSNKISGPTQYLSFRALEEDRQRKNVHDQLDLNQKSNANEAQKVIVIDKAAESHCPISPYPLERRSTQSNSQSHETRMFPYINQPNQSITVAVSPPVVCSHISPISISPQQFGRAPVLPPVSVLPTTGSVIGYTDLRSGCKQHQGGPAQLTIFYAGSVNVFDDVSPEKVQAIMLLATNGAPGAQHKSVPTSEVSGPFKKHVTDEGSNGNRAQSPAFCAIPGTSTVSSGAVSASQGKQICKLDLATVKSVGPLKSPVIARQEPPKAIHFLGSPSTPLFSTVALPQARKASLARFLEKRKERVMSTTPYHTSKKSPESSISKVSDD